METYLKKAEKTKKSRAEYFSPWRLQQTHTITAMSGLSIIYQLGGQRGPARRPVTRSVPARCWGSPVPHIVTAVRRNPSKTDQSIAWPYGGGGDPKRQQTVEAGVSPRHCPLIHDTFSIRGRTCAHKCCLSDIRMMDGNAWTVNPLTLRSVVNWLFEQFTNQWNRSFGVNTFNYNSIAKHCMRICIPSASP